MEKYLQTYNQTVKQINAYRMVMALVGWDSQTLAPKGCFEERGKNIGVLSEVMYKLQTAPEFLEAVEKLCEKRAALDPVLRHEVAEVKKQNDKMKKVPMEEYVKYSELTATSEQTYFQAKANSDFAVFKPVLEQIVAFKRKYMKWLATPECKGYNLLLDEFENGATTDDYDLFFGALKERLVPFAKKIGRTKPRVNKAFLTKNYPVEGQKAFSQYIKDVMCFDMNRGVIAESEHPFTTGTNNTDVRVTIHYYENNFVSAIFSAMHEMGHGLYEQQCDSALNATLSGGGASMAMHESQSRFYENIIGRSREFWQTHFAKLQEIFPKQLKTVTAEDMYRAVNIGKTSFIRVEADELTYALHIMLRYDIERKLMAGKLAVDDLPKEWNRLVKKYLGLTVKNDKEGVLQDVHWSGGAFGYFPTYALGSAYAAQLYHKMKQEIDVPKIIKSGNLKGINEWLREKVHKFGASRDPKEILLAATGESFNPNYYVDYLIAKYSEAYGL